MSDPARPVCPHCGAPLLARAHGLLTCVTHGALVGHALLDQHFGEGSSANVAKLAAKAQQAPRKCPLDRYATSSLRTPGGVEADACGRCGSVWVTWPAVEAAARASGADASGNEQRALLALAIARTLAGAQPAAPNRMAGSRAVTR